MAKMALKRSPEFKGDIDIIEYFIPTYERGMANSITVKKQFGQ